MVGALQMLAPPGCRRDPAGSNEHTSHTIDNDDGGGGCGARTAAFCVQDDASTEIDRRAVVDFRSIHHSGGPHDGVGQAAVALTGAALFVVG